MRTYIPILNMTVGALITRVVLIIIVVIWTIPTLGLLVSSLRDKDLLLATGWWKALVTTERNLQGRTDFGSNQIERDGVWVITGNILEGTSAKSVSAWSVNVNNPTANEIGQVVEINNTQTFSVAEDGTYEWVSTEPFEEDQSRRFFYRAKTPPTFSLDNYREVLSSSGIDRSFINTFTVTIPATIIPIAIAATASYAFSWMEFPGRRFLFAMVVGLLVVPLQLSLIPLLKLYNTLGIEKGYPGIWMAHTGFGLPLAIYLLRNYIGGLPRELIESAQIDGATHFQIFMRLVLPLSVPALASFAIFQFLWVWNDLLVALVFLTKREDQIVMTSRLTELIGSQGNNWEILTSSAFISIIVPVLVFFALQRYFVRGLLAGSVKGG